MFCTKCGTKLADNSNFCCKCGTAINPPEQKDSIEEINRNNEDPTLPMRQPQQQPQSNTSLAADEGVFGILGFALAFSFPLLGLIFSIIGLNKKKYSGFAMAGMILSIIFNVLLVIIIIAVANSSVHYYSYHIPFF